MVRKVRLYNVGQLENENGDASIFIDLATMLKKGDASIFIDLVTML